MTIRKHTARTVRQQSGNAALEVLLLIPFIVLIWALLFNMGYNGKQHRATQAALRMGAFEYVAGLPNMNRDRSIKAAEDAVNDAIFANQGKPAALRISGRNGIPSEVDDSEGILGKMSSRETVTISVTRTPPYADWLTRSPLQGGIILASNTWTYCELKDGDHGSSLMKGVEVVANFGLWMFGGCGGSKRFQCEDRCP